MKTLAVLLRVAIVLLPFKLCAADIVWTNTAGGNWNVAANWSPNSVPGSSDNAFITNNGTYTVTLNAAATITGFVLGGDSGTQTFTNSGQTFTLNGTGAAGSNGVFGISGGTLTGTGTLTVSNVLNWTGGTMGGSGRTVIASGATLNVGGAGGVQLSRTLENAGTAIWTGSGNFNAASGVITNRAGALFEASSDATLNYNGGSNARFDNAGTFRKTTGTGTTTFFSAFALNNYATVEVQTGTLLCNFSFLNSGTVTLSANTTNRLAGGGSATGTFTTPDTALVEWTGGNYTLSSGAALDGAGLYKVNGGNLIINTSFGLQNLDMVSSILDGTGTLTVSNALNWTGGAMNGSGRTVIAPGATLNVGGAGGVQLTTRTLENAGTAIWTGSGNFNAASGSVITNRAGALFSVQNNATFNYNGGSNVRFDNAGTFRKTTGTGTTTFSGPFALNNYGTVEVQTGTLLANSAFLNNGTVTLSANTTNRLAGGGSATGAFTTPDTALVEWTGGTCTLNSGAALTGAGLYKINGGNLIINTSFGLQNLDMVSSILDGTGTLTVSNVLNWTGGAMNGSGRTVIAPGATLNVGGAGGVQLTTRTLENAGTAIWTGSGNFNAASGSVITNRAGALFSAQNNATLNYNAGSNVRFDNAGTFRKTTGTGTTAFSSAFAFNNYATVEVQTGTLLANSPFLNNGTVTLSANTTNRLAGGGSATGAFTTPDTALVEWSGGNYTLSSGAALDGAGLYKVNGGNLIINTSFGMQNLDMVSSILDGTGTLTVSNALNWTGGTMSGSGRTVIASGATLNVGGAGGVQLTTRTLENAGTAIWTGSGNFNAASGSVITNRAGALFSVQNNAMFNYNAGSNVRFDNAGTFRKTTGTGTTTFFSAFALNNYATVELRSGIIAANGGYTFASGSTLTAALGGTNAGTGYGQLQIAGVATLNGALSVYLTNGFYPAAHADSFRVVTAGTRSGTFANFHHPSNDVALVPNYTTTNVTVTIGNLRPVAGTDTHTRARNTSLKIPIAALLTNDHDPELGAITLTGFNLTTTNGATLTTNATTIFFANASNVNDAFTYTIKDTNNLTGTGTVLIQIVSADSSSAVVSLQAGVPGANSNTITFAGIPGYEYVAQYATNVAGPWWDFSTNTVPATGLWSVVDSAATNSPRFYRSLW